MRPKHFRRRFLQISYQDAEAYFYQEIGADMEQALPRGEPGRLRLSSDSLLLRHFLLSSSSHPPLNDSLYLPQVTVPYLAGGGGTGSQRFRGEEDDGIANLETSGGNPFPLLYISDTN